MKEKQYVYCPEYESFIFRAFGDLSIILSIIAFIFWNIFSITMQLNWLLIIIIDITLSFSFIGTPIRYIYHISSLTISEESKTIKIELSKFDKINKHLEFQIENLEVKIVEHWFYRRPIVELRLYSNGKFLCKQRETKNWNVESFKEIRKIILELQQNVNQKS